MIRKKALISIIVVASAGAAFWFYQQRQFVHLGDGQLENPQRINVYFGNEYFNPNMEDCTKIYPVVRQISSDAGAEKRALLSLFQGPTEEEKLEGYTSWFSSDTESILIDFSIEGKTAYVNLNDVRNLLPGVSSSCGSSQFLSEIETTLTQFSGIKRVIFAIEGNPELFYEWIQIGCNQNNDFCDEKPFFKGEGSGSQSLFCGWSTRGVCRDNSDCEESGCSGQVCRSKQEEPVITTCEWRECYNAESYGVQCLCVENKCQWNSI